MEKTSILHIPYLNGGRFSLYSSPGEPIRGAFSSEQSIILHPTHAIPHSKVCLISAVI